MPKIPEAQGPAPKRVAAFTPYFTEAEAGQVRAAFLAAGGPEGYASVSELIVGATMREVKRLQRRHNAGRAWEPVPAGALRRGRRTLDEMHHRHQG